MLTDRTLEELRSARARVTIGFPLWLRVLLVREVVAVTLGRRIYISPRLLLRDRHFEAILRHELVHVRQIRESGLVRFLWSYLGEYVSLRRRGHPPAAAYAANRFEAEARQAEDLEGF